MAKIWESVAGFGDFVCENCGALYAVEVRALQVRDRTAVICQSCRSVMVDWSTGLHLVFHLKECPLTTVTIERSPPLAPSDGADDIPPPSTRWRL